MVQEDKHIPNLFIVGAAKAGTTALVQILQQHQEIFVSPIKEPNFFNSDLDLVHLHPSVSKELILEASYFNKTPLREMHLAIVRDLNNYLKLFKTSKEYTYYCEASTGYLYSNVAAKGIHTFNPNAKIIIMLRDPIKRAWSHYQMDVARGIQENKNALSIFQSDFEAKEKGYLRSHLYIDLSLYYNQIMRFLQVFPKEQILIIQQEDLSKQPALVLQKLENFLQIDCSSMNANVIANETRLPRYSWLRNLKALKRFMPNFVVKRIKKNNFLFEKSTGMDENQFEALQYIETKTKSDWELTLKLIQDIHQ